MTILKKIIWFYILTTYSDFEIIHKFLRKLEARKSDKRLSTTNREKYQFCGSGETEIWLPVKQPIFNRKKKKIMKIGQFVQMRAYT